MKTLSKHQKFSILVSFLIILTINLSSCIFGISGSGDTVQQTINLDEITSFDLAIDADVTLIRGDKQEIEIIAQQNIIDNIKTTVNSGNWTIKFDKKVRNHEPIDIILIIPDISGISITGSGDVFSDDIFEPETLNLDIPGSGAMDLLINCNKVIISIPGSGAIDLFGNSNEQDISISGSGSYYGYSIESNKCDINISGSGNCEVLVNDYLFVTISGSGNVYYKGTPLVNTVITGSGNVINKN